MGNGLWQRLEPMVSEDEEMERLRAKWSRPRDVLERENAPAANTGGQLTKGQQEQLNKITADVKICPHCQAQGTIKRQYGHRVMDEVCEACDGEGCIVKRLPSTADKI